jgi:hypothetical protein
MADIRMYHHKNSRKRDAPRPVSAAWPGDLSA